MFEWLLETSILDHTILSYEYGPTQIVLQSYVGKNLVVVEEAVGDGGDFRSLSIYCVYLVYDHTYLI